MYIQFEKKNKKYEFLFIDLYIYILNYFKQFKYYLFMLRFYYFNYYLN